MSGKDLIWNDSLLPLKRKSGLWQGQSINWCDLIRLINAAGCIIKTNERQRSQDCIGKQIPPGWVLKLNSFSTAWVNQMSKFKRASQANDRIIVQDEKMEEGREEWWMLIQQRNYKQMQSFLIKYLILLSVSGHLKQTYMVKKKEVFFKIIVLTSYFKVCVKIITESVTSSLMHERVVMF